jgi:hypothetical protein
LPEFRFARVRELGNPTIIHPRQHNQI